MASIISLADRARELKAQLAERAPLATAARLIALRDVTTPRITDLLDDWCNARLADGWQPRGVKRYRQQLEALLVWAGEDLRVGQLSRQLIATYKAALGSRPTGRKKRTNSEDQLVSPGTTRNALTAIRAFCEWCVEFELLEENPALQVKHPRVVAPPPLVLSRQQIRELFIAIDAPPQSHKATWPRNRRCICLMLYAGLRREEVADLLWKHIDLERRELQVWYGKGGKSRVVPICAELAAELAKPGRQPGHYAVVDQGDDGEPLGYGNIGHVFERWLPKRWPVADGEEPPLVSPHTLRRTFATELYLRGVDLLTIQRLLGHSDPKTTLRYIAASSEKEHQAVETLRFREDLGEAERTSDDQAGVERLRFREEDERA
jgi:site-specific recombinase XerD